jgi:hypothetical protein
MKLFSEIRLDLLAAQNGAWFAHPMGWRFKLRRANYEPHAEAVRKATTELRARYGGGDIPRRIFREMLAEAAAEHLVVDWDGVRDTATEGQPTVPFDREKLRTVLVDERYEDLYNWVAECASQSAGFREAAAQKSLGK